jgi:ABC-type transporter Mla subunit MlaD
MPTEDLQAYQRHLESFTSEYHPEGATEAHLVQALADNSWRINRVAALETNLLNLVAVGEGIADALAIAASLESQSKALANLSMHSQRLSRQFEHTVDKLNDLQKTRREREEQELENLLDVIEMYQRKGEKFDHSAHGFVFSESQVNAGIHARNRENLIAKAYHYRGQSAA